ncbi:MAG: iron-containing alcohol dehydrogenase [Victivallaceae bacterium]|nr:iron-containing alcohol dehydrogenase [Victivallaceae bacterium]NLK84064.1 iron-containing alcohol dehydrogenase [Lentisphaerota bacterium]MDD3116518.1 iron-containing alcohol dehydrogenase [Victivallaceae bacterium]MDD3704089.1 iron-containing alcohol dehydrogenase [Victivallaceae bacterium]MDD4318439.1 iron-containing alcohol dehydrogenase [Victivallaceae bacterium]
MWKNSININDVREIRMRNTVFFGVGAIAKIDFIMEELKKRDIKNVLLVCGKNSYKSTGAWDHVNAAMTKHKIGYEIYDNVTPNPTADQVDEAVALGKKNLAGAVVCIGGGSPIDTGKSAAILLKNPQYNARDLFNLKFTPAEALPVIAINLTHGTGSETNRFAVVTIPEKNHKPAIAFDCIYPLYAIDDPALTAGLSLQQTCYVSIDAVNHALEAATSKAANPFAITLATQTIDLVNQYLPLAMANPDDLTARYFLMYAAMLAGTAFDNSLLHYTHALEHPLSAVKPELSHGLGLAMLLPAVIENIYPACGGVLAHIFSPAIPGFTGKASESSKFARKVEKWLAQMGAGRKLTDDGFSENDVGMLVDLVFNTPSLDSLIGLAPTIGTYDAIANIYNRSLYPMPDETDDDKE